MAQKNTKRVCVLEEALQPHLVNAPAFMPFVIGALGNPQAVGTQTTEFTVTLENMGQNGVTMERLRLQWQGGTITAPRPPTHSRGMAELAACGIACALLWHYTGLRVLAAAEFGQGFDYWIGTDTEQQGLEISGTQTDDESELRDRHREKCHQLFSVLPVGGYVIVVGFARREVILSYHEPKEAME
jgi:hypothetical protein